MQSLNNSSSPEEKLEDLVRKYAELVRITVTFISNTDAEETCSVRFLEQSTQSLQFSTLASF